MVTLSNYVQFNIFALMDAKQKAIEIFNKHLATAYRGDCPNDYFKNKALLHSHLTIETIMSELDRKNQGFLTWDVVDFYNDVKKQLDLIEW